MDEVQIKLARIRRMLDAEGLEGVLLTKKHHFAWLTGGRDCHIETVGEAGAAQLLITSDQQIVLCNNIEAGRLAEEELAGLPFTVQTYPWYLGAPRPPRLTAGRWGADAEIPGLQEIGLPLLARLRGSLTREEIERYRWLGERTAAILEAVCREIRVGEEERQVGARLAYRLLGEGITPYVTLIAADERVFRYRHPVPTAKPVERYVMVVICAEKYGLIANLTRLVHFGPLPEELRRKLDAALQVEAVLVANTRPGRRMDGIFSLGVMAYDRTGFKGQWEDHHQGGPTGYLPRDYVVTQQCMEAVQENQAFAWNPSITGVKTEDTVLVTADGFEWLTYPGDWPVHDLTVQGRRFHRPAILIK